MAHANMNNDSELDAAGRTAGNVADKVREAGAEIAGKAEEAGRAAADGAAELTREISDKLKTVGIDTDAMLNAAREQAGGWQKSLADEVNSRPLRTLGMAAVAGLVVGLLVTR